MQTNAEIKRIAKIDSLMAKLGLPAVNEAVEDAPPAIAYACDVCGGLGFVYPDVEVTDPAYGKLVECPVGCEAVMVQRERVREGQMGRLMQVIDRQAPPVDQTLETYCPVNEDQAVGLQVAQVYCERLAVEVEGVSKNWLVLQGTYGSGKTFLASVISNELEARGHVSWYMKFSEMVYRYNDTWQNKDSEVTQHQIVRALQRVDVLILDDVFDEHITNATRRLFFDVMDTRMDLNRPTVLTTNLSQDDVKRVFGGRTASRIVHKAHWIRMDGSVRDKTGIL